MAKSRKKTTDLFQAEQDANLKKAQPLAARMRPTRLEDFVGQDHFLGPGKLLRRLLQADRLSSVIFYGPPGTGKTALAHVIAQHTHCHFHDINAVAAGMKCATF
jgi:putative ATPase